MLVGFCVPTGDQVAPGPTTWMDSSVPPEGLHEIAVLPPEIETDKMIGEAATMFHKLA